MSTKNNSYYIGTSGWHYKHWSGPFYPEDISHNNFLEYYAKDFNTVEINNSFYQLPDSKTLKQWRDAVPSGFIFSIKASRYITHMKKLKDSEKPVRSFLHAVRKLGKKLGPILFQLPPNWNINPDRLRKFMEVLPTNFRYAFEFRDPSWFDPKVYEILDDYKAAFCIYDLDGNLSPKEVTTDFIYIRLHGPDGPYKGQYQAQVLAGWAGAFTAWDRQKKTIYCYFDNDEAGYAPEDALKLKAMMEE